MKKRMMILAALALALLPASAAAGESGSNSRGGFFYSVSDKQAPNAVTIEVDASERLAQIHDDAGVRATLPDAWPESAQCVAAGNRGLCTRALPFAPAEINLGEAGDVLRITGEGALFAEIYTGAGVDHVTGGNGRDLVMDPGEQNPVQGDLLDGGPGSLDTVHYWDAHGPVRAFLTDSALRTEQDDRLVGFENLWGSNFGDRLVGSDGPNDIRDFHGDDRIEGLGGADVLWLAGGADVVRAGSGDDTIHLYDDDAADDIDCGEGHDRVLGTPEPADVVSGCEEIDAS